MSALKIGSVRSLVRLPWIILTFKPEHRNACVWLYHKYQHICERINSAREEIYTLYGLDVSRKNVLITQLRFMKERYYEKLVTEINVFFKGNN